MHPEYPGKAAKPSHDLGVKYKRQKEMCITCKLCIPTNVSILMLFRFPKTPRDF
jgi:hypothetical protein